MFFVFIYDLVGFYVKKIYNTVVVTMVLKAHRMYKVRKLLNKL